MSARLPCEPAAAEIQVGQTTIRKPRSMLKPISEAVQWLLLKVKTARDAAEHSSAEGQTVLSCPAIGDVIELVERSGATPLAIDAYWDGDTTGWFVRLAADCSESLNAGDNHDELHLGFYRRGGDIRLFNGHVPPWPEAVEASAVGNAVASHFGIPFYFPSPSRPEDDCPRWRERHLATPCRLCRIPLLQEAACPWRGVCHACHLIEQREGSS